DRTNVSNGCRRRDPQYPTAYTSRGLAYAAKREYDRAITDYDQAIRLNPTNVQAYHNRGVAYYEKNAYDRAIADFDEAIRLNPKSSSVYTSRGHAYYAKGAYDRAIEDYDQAILLEPNSPQARQYRVLANRLQGKPNQPGEAPPGAREPTPGTVVLGVAVLVGLLVVLVRRLRDSSA